MNKDELLEEILKIKKELHDRKIYNLEIKLGQIYIKLFQELNSEEVKNGN